MEFPIVKAIKNLLVAYTPWGRVADRQVFNLPPRKNPDVVADTQHGERYFRISLNPYVKAGLIQRDVSRLFVTAKGLEPDESGAYHPAQLIYTDPEHGNEEQRERLARQYDETFFPPFATILRSLHQPALTYGRAIGEVIWYKENGSLHAATIKSRDPDEFILDPPEEPPGIYQKRSIYSTSYTKDYTRVPDGKFFRVTYDSLFNNPYGTSLLRPLANMTETWDNVYDAWRMGLIKSGYGSWLGEYDVSISGESAAAISKRALFLEEVGKIANGTASIFDARNNIRAEKLQLDAQAFLDFHEAFIKAVGVVMLGNPTALTEGSFGSYSREEATGTRRKSETELSDALLMTAAFYPFNAWFLKKNFASIDAIPQLQLIRPELIVPTTPEGQKTQDEIQRDSVTVNPAKALNPAELQEEEPERVRPEFPDSGPDPDIYQLVREEAQEYLAALPVLPFEEVTRENQADIFTVKILRTWPDDEEIALLNSLKGYIEETFDAPSEQAAWESYLDLVDNDFARRGLELNSDLERELMPSFRQARQRAWQAGIDRLVEDNPGIIDRMRLQTRDDPRVRPIHALWNDVVLDIEDPRLDRLKTPMDFMCRCNWLPVLEAERDQYPLTPESDIPTVFPGKSYRGYA